MLSSDCPAFIAQHHRPRLRGSLRTLLTVFLVAAFALLVGIATAGAQDNAPQDLDKILDTARAQMDKVQKTLEARADKAPRDAELVDLRKSALEAQEKAQAAAGALEPQLAKVQARMAELGVPAEGVTEARDVAVQRAELTKTSTKLDAQIKLARLIAVEAGQTGDQILKLRRSMFQAELGVRTSSILSAAFWSELNSQLPQDMRRLEPLRVELIKAVQTGGANVWSAVLAAVLVVLGLRVVAGRVLLLITTTRVAPGRLRRSLYAVAQVILAIVTPGVIAQIAHLGLGWNTGLSENLDTVLAQTVGAVYFSGLVAGLGRALLSPDRPTWRLLPLADSVALALRWVPPALAVIIVAGWATQKLAAQINASLIATVAQNCIVSLMLCLVLALAMRIASQLRRRAIAQAAEQHARPAPFAFVLLRTLTWLAVTASLVSLLLGYIALGSFIVKQAAWVAIVLAAAYLLNGLLDDGCQSLLAAIRRNASDENYSRPMTRMRGQATVVLAGIARLLVLLFALILLAAPFGDGPTAWLQRLDALHSGIAIGEIQLRPTAVVLAILVLLLGLGAVKLVQAWLAKQYLPTTSLDPGMRLSAATLFGYAGYVLAIALSLSAVGIGLERVAWIASALSVGIGFGLQAVVQNFVSGIILLAERPVKVGDWVSLGGVEGDIRRINVRATEIQMGDRSTVIVPNSEFITKVVRNVTHASPLGRVQIKLALPIGTNAEDARTLMLTAFEENEEILSEPMPDVMLDGVDASGLVFNATGYVSSPRSAYRVRSDLLFEILKRLHSAGIPLASPPTMVLKEVEAYGDASDTGRQNQDSQEPGTSLA